VTQAASGSKQDRAGERSLRHRVAVGLRALALAGAALGSTAGLAGGPRAAAVEGRKEGGAVSLEIRSPAFAHGGEIPARFTCEGEDVSPPLAWSGAPDGARSLALVVDDPDAPDPRAPRTTWVHWVVYDLPAASQGLPEAVGRDAAPPREARQGRNDWQRVGWGGPCPPVGRHRYFFKLYALDVALGDRGAATKAELERAMQGHVLARAELVGTYEKRAERGGR
jgi:Raf kinase inhibitor-like YbhB/YbcL family protein